MTIQDAKQIKLADYLQSLGYTPIKPVSYTHLTLPTIA